MEKFLYGANADWADNYFAKDSTGIWTQGRLEHAFNVDVTQLDPAMTPLPSNVSGESTIAYSPSTSHGWPYRFYLTTISNTAPSCADGYGFPLSMEAGGSNNWAGFTRNNSPLPLCGTVSVSQTQKPVRTNLALNITSLPYTASSAGVDFTGNGGATLFSTLSPSSFSLKDAGGIQPNGGSPSTNVPAWLSVGLTITNPVNFVQFDAAFTDINSAEGLLTVYWDTNQIGLVDERVASTNSRTYRLALPGTVASGFYVLGFRLDSFNDTLSSVAVTNVATGFVGVNQPLALGVAMFTNSTPILQLTGASNYNYLVESSTNLVNWTPTALLANSNGTVFFADKTTTNSPARFYRATMP